MLLVSSSVRSKQLLCFVHGQGQKSEQKHTTKSFDEFHNHSPLLTTAVCVHIQKDSGKNLPVNSLSKSFVLSNLHTIYAQRQGEPTTKRNSKITQAEALVMIVLT